MEVYYRSTRPSPGSPGRTILELDSPERGGLPTMLVDDGQSWRPTGSFAVPPYGTARFVREDGRVEVTPMAYRNALINGGFEVWQGDRILVPPTFTTYLGCDQWSLVVGVPGSYTWSRQAGITAGSEYCLRMSRNAASTDTNGLSIRQTTEPKRTVQMLGRRSVLSFSVRASPTALLDPVYGNAHNFLVKTYSDAALTTVIKEQTFAVTDALQRLSVPVDIPASATQLGMSFGWRHSVTPAGAADYVDLDDVQWELGDLSDFERLPFQVDLRMCQPYFQKSFEYDTVPAQAAGTTGGLRYPNIIAGVANGVWGARFGVSMRAAPTITYYNPVNANAFTYNTATGTDATATSAQYVGQNGFGVLHTGLAAWAAGNGLLVHYTADARL